MATKLRRLSPGLRAKIKTGESPRTHALGHSPISQWLVNNKLHCNGGKTVEAGLWLRDHCDNGGKIFLTMSGAGSSFQQGKIISRLIRAGKVAGISVTGANLEESLYRLLAHSHYAVIPDYQELTRDEEKELDDAGLRRITDTFLPEEESVRLILPHMERLWAQAEKTGKHRLWHEYFWQLFEENVIDKDPMASWEDCWLYQAWKFNITIFVGGVEDSTMGNIFAHACYNGKHPFLGKYKLKKPVSPEVVQHSFRYMHALAEWYMDNTVKQSLAFLQLGGGIAADFPICVVPHLKKDFLHGLSLRQQEKLVRAWAGFIEIHTSPMSVGSYSGAGFKEKITWSKFDVNAYGAMIFGDYTSIFPDIAALVLRE